MNRFFRLFTALFFIATIAVLDSCSSGKAAYEQGNYYESVMTSVNRLRRNADHKKSVETLRQAYPLAVRYYEDQATHVLASQNEFKWTSVVQSYTMINMMYDEIKRSPGALKVVPNPVNFYGKLEQAKNNAAGENYEAGIRALMVGSRDKAKDAYRLFVNANNFVVGYKDVNSYMEQALLAATLKVMVTPIPATRNVAWSAEFFNDKVSEFLHTASIDEFVKFYSVLEVQTLQINPDQIIQLEFDEFVVGNVSIHEKQIQLEKDSVVMATYVSPGSQSTSGTAQKTNLTSGDIQVTQTTSGAVGKGSPNQGTTQNNTTQNNTTQNNTVQNNTVQNNTTQNNTTQNNTTQNNTVQNNTTQNNTVQNNTTQNNNTSTQSNTGAQQNQDQSNATVSTTGGNNGNSSTTENNGGGNKEKDKNSQSTHEDKVTICHKPPGNTSNTQSLTLPLSAVQAHLDHGDAIGFCEESKSNNKPAENKGNGNKNGGGASYGSLMNTDNSPLIASTETHAWMFAGNLQEQAVESDTVTVYGKVKATFYHYQKTITSKGIVSFRIIDAKTNAILSAEKMPGQYVWISEWATFNGDERALTPTQLEIAQQRERAAPPAQDLFIAFTQPIYSQLTSKIQSFYRNY